MGLSISIPPVAILLIVIVTGNCILSLRKSNLMNKCYIILSSLFSIMGIVGMIIIRPLFLESLYRNANNRKFDSGFVAWAIKKFDSYAFISIIVISSVIVFSLFYFFISENRDSFVWANTTTFIIALMVINFIAVIWYSLGTINKLFDIAGYIMQLSAAEFFALHIPIVVKRILVYKKKIKQVSHTL